MGYYFNADYASLDPEELQRHEQVFEYFGTFNRCFFSTWELTLANWPTACRVLGENVSESFFWFGMAYKLSIGFSVLAVVQGVFMQETFKVAAMDDVLMVRQKERQSKLHAEKMRRFLAEADKGDNDGQICLQGWLDIVSDPQVSLWLGSMELDSKDAPGLFKLIDKDHN